MRTESLDNSYFALPDGSGPYPGVVVVHEAFGLNDNIRDICGRFAGQGYAALGVDLFEGRSRALCMARMLVGGLAGNLDYYGVPARDDLTTRCGRRRSTAPMVPGNWDCLDVKDGQIQLLAREGLGCCPPYWRPRSVWVRRSGRSRWPSPIWKRCSCT